MLSQHSLGAQESWEMRSGVGEALVQGNNRSTWALIRLIQCIRGPRLRRLVYEGGSAEVRGEKYSSLSGGY